MPRLGLAVSCLLAASIVNTGNCLIGLRTYADEISEKEEDSKRNATSAEAVRSVGDIHKDLRRLEKETAKLKQDSAKAKNIAALCHLFIEVGQHPDIVKSPTLQSINVRLRNRLRGIERRTVDELKRRKIPEPEEMVQEQKSKRQARFQRGRTGTKASFVSGSAGDSSDLGTGRDSAKPTQTSSGNRAPGPDYGWQLVNLIRKTIRPDYWSVTGGPGKAIYFGHSRALVIHGSWRVQEDVADLLAALRGG